MKGVRKDNKENKHVVFEEKKAYELRQRRISSYKNRYHQYDQEMKKAMELSKREALIDLTYLNNVLAGMGLRQVEVEGDGNCFFRAVAVHFFGDSNRYNEIRARAVQYVIDHPEDFSEFLLNRDVEDFTCQLSTDRQWADNHAIQAVADAFGITIDLVNSNPRYGTRRITPRSSEAKRLIVLAHIDQVHFMATEPNYPFETSTYGGINNEVSLINTCSLDGTLSWLMISMEIFPKLQSVLKEIDLIAQVFDTFQEGKSAHGKVIWYESVNDKINSDGDLFGSESAQFFEPLCKTDAAKLSYHKSCTSRNPFCVSRTIEKTYLLVDRSKKTFKDKIEAAGEIIYQPCSSCGENSTMRLDELPPFLFFPKDYLSNDDEIPSVLNVNGVIFILLILTLYDNSKNHFTSFFRTNNRYWIRYNGMEKRKEQLFLQPNVTLENLQHLGYGRLDKLHNNNQDVYTEEYFSLPTDKGMLKLKIADA